MIEMRYIHTISVFCPHIVSIHWIRKTTRCFHQTLLWRFALVLSGGLASPDIILVFCSYHVKVLSLGATSELIPDILFDFGDVMWE